MSILENTSEDDLSRGDALNAILKIDEWLARDIAIRYENGGPNPDYLARTAQSILAGGSGFGLPGRSYIEALLHRHY